MESPKYMISDFIVTEGYSMSNSSSLGTGGDAEYYAEPRDVGEAMNVMELAYKRSLPVTIIGGGTHILVSDEGIPGIVVSTRCMRGISIRGDMIVALPGEMLDGLINIAIEHRLKGLEEIAGIPGTIAGALSVNANANGRSISDLFLYADVLTSDGKIHRFPHYKDVFSYQETVIGQNGGMIISIALCLIPSIKTAESRMKKEVFVEKMFIPPAPRFSSIIYKDPDGMRAADLIKRAGATGKNGTRAEFSEYEGNTIFTYAGCTSSEIYQAMIMAESKVKEKFGITLERSITLLGSFKDPETEKYQ